VNRLFLITLRSVKTSNLLPEKQIWESFSSDRLHLTFIFSGWHASSTWSQWNDNLELANLNNYDHHPHISSVSSKSYMDNYLTYHEITCMIPLGSVEQLFALWLDQSCIFPSLIIMMMSWMVNMIAHTISSFNSIGWDSIDAGQVWSNKKVYTSKLPSVQLHTHVLPCRKITHLYG